MLDRHLSKVCIVRIFCYLNGGHQNTKEKNWKFEKRLTHGQGRGQAVKLRPWMHLFFCFFIFASADRRADVYCHIIQLYGSCIALLL